MLNIPKFGPYAQTVAQRQAIVERMLDYFAQLHLKLPAHADDLHHRYVAGELSWLEVCELRSNPVQVTVMPAQPA
ncbi:hypothetical protein [Hymenobacter sp. UYP22]|uniref:hypothetical protein n=1 Tax=Hymenobacter sp. UYP22 TaxID=3156348 RepID=UPI0033946C03